MGTAVSQSNFIYQNRPPAYLVFLLDKTAHNQTELVYYAPLVPKYINSVRIHLLFQNHYSRTDYREKQVSEKGLELVNSI